MNKLRKAWLDIKTFILMCLPLCFYIWMLRKVSNTRLNNYAGIVGDNPMSLIVYNGIVMIDLENLQV